MQLAMGVVHAQPLAQRIQRITLAREPLPRQQKRVLDRTTVLQSTMSFQAPELGIEETHVEGRVVDDQLGAFDEGQELIDHLRETRLVGQELPGQAGDFLRTGLELPIRIEVALEGPPGRAALQQFHAPDLDHAVALAPLKARGFRVQHDLPHDRVLRISFPAP